MILHAMTQPPVYLAAAGVATAWFMYLKRPDLPGVFKDRLAFVYRVLVNKYWFDDVNYAVFAEGGRAVGRFFWKIGDVKVIDGFFVNGTARAIGWFAGVIRHIQTGFLYHYAFAMILGLVLLIGMIAILPNT
jgi:NADH-quinone oxidoreductase subunit L